MKKLLVLAAVAAMAMSAKAEYTWTVEIPNAQSVYMIACGFDESMLKAAWSQQMKPMLLDDNTILEGNTWAERYAYFSAMLEQQSDQRKFSGTDGSFSISNEQRIPTWGLLALEDADSARPGAKYTFYYGESAADGGAITLNPISGVESGYLRTDPAPAPVPEPTSGLLLLLGVAGLALKRKRA